MILQGHKSGIPTGPKNPNMRVQVGGAMTGQANKNNQQKGVRSSSNKMS